MPVEMTQERGRNGNARRNRGVAKNQKSLERHWRPMQVLTLHRSQDSFSTGFGGRGWQRMWVLMQMQRRTCRWEDEVVLILQKSIFSMKYTARSSAENGTGEGVLET